MTTKSFYTAKQINELRTAAQHYKLDAPTVFWTKTANELKKVCNGIGPEDWDSDKRKAVTLALKPYEAAASIHDVEYHWHKGTRKQADKRFRKNMIRTWRKNFGFWRWFSVGAWIERFKVIPFVYIAVVAGGGDAWEKGIDS